MSELAFLRPTNETAEREKFIASLSGGGGLATTAAAAAAVHEPQFQYADAKRAADIRRECDQHLTDEFEAQALAIVEGIRRDYGSEDGYCESVWGRLLDSDEVDCACDAYLQQNEGLRGKVLFEWNPNVLVTMCGVPKEGPGKVRLVTRPNYYRETRLASLLDHEVGTHFIRSHNHKCAFPRRGGTRPPFAHRKGWLIATEEGLATLNTNKAYADKRLWVPAIHYLATLLASRLPFSALWRELGRYIGESDHERLWTICLRVKRGMTDTGRPGGYHKDGSNFVGALRLLRMRKELDFRLLHCVRTSIEDFPRAVPAARAALQAGTVILPAFVRDDAALDAYHAALDEMAAVNGIDPPPGAQAVDDDQAGRRAGTGSAAATLLGSGGSSEAVRAEREHAECPECA